MKVTKDQCIYIQNEGDEGWTPQKFKIPEDIRAQLPAHNLPWCHRSFCIGHMKKNGRNQSPRLLNLHLLVGQNFIRLPLSIYCTKFLKGLPNWLIPFPSRPPLKNNPSNDILSSMKCHYFPSTPSKLSFSQARHYNHILKKALSNILNFLISQFPFLRSAHIVYLNSHSMMPRMVRTDMMKVDQLNKVLIIKVSCLLWPESTAPTFLSPLESSQNALGLSESQILIWPNKLEGYQL